MNQSWSDVLHCSIVISWRVCLRLNQSEPSNMNCPFSMKMTCVDRDYQPRVFVLFPGDGVTAYSLHPGVIKTELGRHFMPTIPWYKAIIFKFVAPIILKTPWEGMQTTLHCALEDNLPNGAYFRYKHFPTFSCSSSSNLVFVSTVLQTDRTIFRSASVMFCEALIVGTAMTGEGIVEFINKSLPDAMWILPYGYWLKVRVPNQSSGATVGKAAINGFETLSPTLLYRNTSGWKLFWFNQFVSSVFFCSLLFCI